VLIPQPAGNSVLNPQPAGNSVLNPQPAGNSVLNPQPAGNSVLNPQPAGKSVLIKSSCSSPQTCLEEAAGQPNFNVISIIMNCDSMVAWFV
jgi:hypothetical protein